jgi:hypothetical protein
LEAPPGVIDSRHHDSIRGHPKGSRVVLLKLSDKISECYRLALDAREKAEATLDPDIKDDFLFMEQRWLFLASSYETVERIAEFTGVKPRYVERTAGRRSRRKLH